MWGLTPLDTLWCRIKFKQSRYDGPMTPPAAPGWIYSTGFLGGIDWGSVAVDKVDDMMIVNSFVMASRNRFVTAAEFGNDPKAKLPFPFFHQEGSPYFAVFTALFRSPLGDALPAATLRDVERRGPEDPQGVVESSAGDVT